MFNIRIEDIGLDIYINLHKNTDLNYDLVWYFN